MNRLKFTGFKHLNLHSAAGVLAVGLILVLASLLVLPVVALGFAPPNPLQPLSPQETPTPFEHATQNSRLNSSQDPWVDFLKTGFSQNLLTRSQTPRTALGQLPQTTGEPLPLLPLLASATQNSPVGETASGVTGEKDVIPSSASIGEHLHFRIRLTNESNEHQALDLKVIDEIPSYLTFVPETSTTTRGTIDFVDNQVIVFMQNLDTRQTVEIDIDTIVNNLAFGGFYDNFATFTYYYINDQFQGQTNIASYQITTGPPTPPPSGFPLASLKTVSGSPAFQGDLLGFTIVIRNVGIAPADNLVVTDVFPNFLDIINVSTTLGTVQPSQNPVIVNVGSLAVLQEVRIEISTRVIQDVSGIFTNTANFTYTYQALPGAGATNAAFYQIGGQVPRLVGQKTVSSTWAGAGDSLGFYIEIVNVGTAAAFNIEVTDVFPSYLTITRVTTSKGTVHINQNTVRINVDTLVVNEVLRINISTVVNQGVTGTITATNFASFKYQTFQFELFSGYTNTVVFQIGGTTSGGLPPTGGIEKRSTGQNITSISLAFGTVCLIFGVFILRHKPRRKFLRNLEVSWVRSMGIVLLVVGFCFTLVACAGRELTAEQEKASTSVPSTPISSSTKPSTQSLSEQAEPSASPTLSALPDYPIPTPAFVAGAGDNDISFDVSPIRRIIISKIDLDTIVKYVPFDGLSWKIAGLNTEVVWMGETSWPGLGSNTGLSAHVSLPDGSAGPFRRLSELKAGDLVVLFTEENKYIYSVRSQEVVSESDMTVLQPTDQSQITMITCTDWNDAIQKYLNRLIVYSDLVDIQPINQINSSQ